MVTAPEGPWVESTKQACLGPGKGPHPPRGCWTYIPSPDNGCLGNPENEEGRWFSEPPPQPPSTSCTRSQNGKKGHFVLGAGWGGQYFCAYSPAPSFYQQGSTSGLRPALPPLPWGSWASPALSVGPCFLNCKIRGWDIRGGQILHRSKMP